MYKDINHFSVSMISIYLIEDDAHTKLFDANFSTLSVEKIGNVDRF